MPAQRERNWAGIGVGVMVARGGLGALAVQWQTHLTATPPHTVHFWGWLSYTGSALIVVGVLGALYSSALLARRRIVAGALDSVQRDGTIEVSRPLGDALASAIDSARIDGRRLLQRVPMWLETPAEGAVLELVFETLRWANGVRQELHDIDPNAAAIFGDQQTTVDPNGEDAAVLRRFIVERLTRLARLAEGPSTP